MSEQENKELTIAKKIALDQAKNKALGTDPKDYKIPTPTVEQVVQWNLDFAGIPSETYAKMLNAGARNERRRNRELEALIIARAILYFHRMGRISPSNKIDNLTKLLTAYDIDKMIAKGIKYYTFDEKPTELMLKIRDLWFALKYEKKRFGKN